MARTPLESFLLEKTLRIINGYDNGRLIDHLAESGEAQLPLKNVCAKVSVQLSDDIDKVVTFLDVSKRQFLEMAFIEAVNKAHKIMEEEGVFERHGPLFEAVEGEEAA